MCVDDYRGCLWLLVAISGPSVTLSGWRWIPPFENLFCLILTLDWKYFQNPREDEYLSSEGCISGKSNVCLCAHIIGPFDLFRTSMTHQILLWGSWRIRYGFYCHIPMILGMFSTLKGGGSGLWGLTTPKKLMAGGQYPHWNLAWVHYQQCCINNSISKNWEGRSSDLGQGLEVIFYEILARF